MQQEEIRNELIKAVDEANGWQSLRHLMLRLKKEDSEIVLDALLSIFFLENHDSYQAAAGGLLWKLKPKYKRNLRDDILQSLKGWNVSIEELPWYFAEMTGVEEVRKVVETLLTESLKDVEKRELKTYLYWLSVSSPEEFRTKLNQQWNRILRG